MYDELALKKKTIRKCVRSKKLTRKEKYKSVKKIIKEMKHKEKLILYKEFKRDKESFEWLSNANNIIVMGVSIISMMLTIFLASVELRVELQQNNVNYSPNDMSNLLNPSLCMIFIVGIIIILLITFVDLRVNNGKNYSQYVIDIFEDELSQEK